MEQISAEYQHIQCPLCCKSDAELIYENKEYMLQTLKHTLTFDISYNICRTCGLVYMSPQLSQSCWQQYYRYATMGSSMERIDALEQLEKKFFITTEIREYMDNFVRDNSKILEVGCGGGYLLHYLRKKYNCECLGVELSDALIDFAAQEYQLDIRNTRIEDADLPLDYFDVVIAFDVFEHTVNPVIAFNKAYSLLHEQGIMIFTVPSVYCPVQSLRDIYSAHSFLFSPVNIKNLYEMTNFEIIDQFEKASRIIGILKKSKSKNKRNHYSDYLGIKTFFDDFKSRYNNHNVIIQERLRALIDSWHHNQARIMIWGAGEHTTHLLQKTDFSSCNIKGLIDSNTRLWDRTVSGYKVYSPQVLNEMAIDEVMISSHAYEKDIESAIKQINDRIIIRKIY